jgi:uncharacterized membrane protein
MNDELHTIDSANRTTILVHYYRGMVGRADVWRTRMDTTTNWAIGATAAIISFSLGNDSVSHYVVFIASLMTWSFLLLEARRLTFYNLWQQRVLLLEQGLIRPAISATGERGERDEIGERGEIGERDEEAAAIDTPLGASARGVDLSTALDAHLGRTVPTMPLTKAIARRLRRVYLYLFGVQLLAWSLKLANHPTSATSIGSVLERARIGVLPGGFVIATAVGLALVALLISITRGGVDRDPA